MTRDRAPARPVHLLERDRELAAVDTCISAAASGEGSFFVARGHAGMGKSALLAEVRRRADRAGFMTCSAIGSELEDEFAFGVVRQLFEPAIGALGKQERARVFEGAGALAEPVLDAGREPAVGGQFAALHGLYWLAANLSDERPLLIALDDAHWADAASLRWLAYVLNRLDGVRMLVAIASRPSPSDPQSGLLATILAHRRPLIVDIGPLGEDSVSALVRSTLGADPEPSFMSACLKSTAGNPLALNELLRDLRVGGVAPTGAAAADLDRRAPDAIARRVQRDLGLLGDDAERMARALAVIGDRTELRLVARLADLEVDAAAGAADDLLGADLIAPERPPRFAHPLLRAAVYDSLPAGSRQRLHRRAAEILAAEAADPETVAAHLLRCEPGRSSETVTWLRAAAPVALSRGAPTTAVSYLKRAAAENAGTAIRSAVLAELGSAEQVAGDPAAAGHLREALTGTTDRRSRGAILCDLAMVLGYPEDTALQIQAIEELRPYDPGAATRLELIVKGGSAADGRLAASVEAHLSRFRDLARSRDPNAELARATLAAVLSWRDGKRDEVLSWVGSGFDWKFHYEARPMRSFSVHWVMLALRGIDELQQATRFCEEVLRAAVADGYVLVVATAMMHKANAELGMGLLADAEADASAAYELSQQYVPPFAPGIAASLAEIRLERGQGEAAYRAIEDICVPSAEAAEETEAGGRAVFREIRGRMRCARGWRKEGIDDFRESGRLCELLLLRNPIMWPWRASLAAALAGDSPDEARRFAQENLANARRSGIPRGIGVALRTLARLDGDNRVELLRAAVDALGESPAQLERARVLADLGSALRRQGDRAEARARLLEALDIAARCGAVPLMEQVRAEAVAAGARPRRPRLRGVDALTPGELRVARLAAEGQSNREIAQALFITWKTSPTI